MSTIYLPSDYINNCNVVYNGYIRSYLNNNNTQWVDIYINQDYMLKPGSSNYSQVIQCDGVNTYTTNIFYRTDIDRILIIFIILFFICLILPYKVFSRFFGRWLKL